LGVFYSYSVGGDVKDCRLINDINDACGGNNKCDIYEKIFFDGFTLSQGGSDVKIFFRSPYGKVFGNGIIKILQSGQGYSKNIKVNEYGKINIQ